MPDRRCSSAASAPPETARSLSALANEAATVGSMEINRPDCLTSQTLDELDSQIPDAIEHSRESNWRVAWKAEYLHPKCRGGGPALQTDEAVEFSPATINRGARLTGAMYIPYLAFGVPLFLRTPLIVPTDASATAANILASERLYRITVVTDLVSYGLYIVLAYLFYTLLRQVNRP